MEVKEASELMYRKLLDFDQFCFKNCVKVPGKKFTVKEENCLSPF